MFTYTHAHARAYAHAHARAYAHAHACAYAHAHARIYAYAHACAYAYIHACAYVHAHMHMHMQTLMLMRTHMTCDTHSVFLFINSVCGRFQKSSSREILLSSSIYCGIIQCSLVEKGKKLYQLTANYFIV